MYLIMYAYLYMKWMAATIWGMKGIGIMLLL